MQDSNRWYLNIQYLNYLELGKPELNEFVKSCIGGPFYESKQRAADKFYLVMHSQIS